MASWTTPVTHATGDVLAVSDWNGLANDAIFLYQAPYIYAYNSVATSCPSGAGTNTQITLGGTLVSGYGMSISSNNIKAPLAGIYGVSWSAEMGSGAAGSGATYWESSIFLNGTFYATGSIVPSYTSFPCSTGSAIVSCNANDLIELTVTQTSGFTVLTNAGATNTYLNQFFIGSK